MPKYRIRTRVKGKPKRNGHHNVTPQRGARTRNNRAHSERLQLEAASKIVNRAQKNPKLLSANDIVQLQRAIGNRAIGRILSDNTTKKGAGPVNDGLKNEIQRVRGQGSPMTPAVRQKMEGHFDTDFHQVSIHTDKQADTLSQKLNARAFTTGQDIFFKQDEYRPQTETGKRLLAHELTHVIQQRGAGLHRSGNVQKMAIQKMAIQPDAVSSPATGPLIQRGILGKIGSFLKKGLKVIKKAAKLIKNRLAQVCGKKIGAEESKNILEDVFDGREFDVDNIVVADEAGIQKAWDDIYGEGSYDGSNGKEPDGPLEGFTAPDNTIYINKTYQAVDTLPHEILHRHENGAVINQMGENFNEGFTEYLTQKAVSKMGYSPTSSYPDDLAVVKKMVPLIGGDENLENAYFDGDLNTLKTELNKAKGAGTYKKIVAAMKAGNYAKALKLLD